MTKNLVTLNSPITPMCEMYDLASGQSSLFADLAVEGRGALEMKAPEAKPTIADLISGPSAG